MGSPLSEVSDSRGARTRKTLQLVLQSVSRVGQVSIARSMSVDEATVSRIKNERLEQSIELILAAGCKVVPAEMQCYRPASIASILQLAKERMEQLESPDQLQWDDE